MLKAAAGNAQCFSECVDTMTRVALTNQSSPPVDATNEMLRLCAVHNDQAALHQIVEVLNQASGGVAMNSETFERLQDCFTYFPADEQTRLAR